MQELNKNRIKNLYWDKNYTVREIADELRISVWTLYNFMNKNNIQRRNYSDANFLVNKTKPQFKIKENLTVAERRLKIAGIMLYWAEGTQKGGTVDFANSNPQMVKIFLRFLREICGVDERRLRGYLYAYEYQDIEKLKSYWCKATGIHPNQFTKPYVRRGNLNLSHRKMLYGLAHIRYNDTKLLGIIGNWINAYIEECGEVPKRSNGSGCEERSVSKKFGMEKRVNSGEPLLTKS
jgi:predicted DNA-binding protein YlxM (UPF0122 family)